MSSSISAGTTAGTALNFSGDTSGALVLQTNGTTTAVTISTAQVVTLAQPLPVASGGSGVTTSTGTGANVLSTSPTLVTPLLGTVTSGNISACTSTSMVLVTPILGTPTSGNLANCTGIPAPAALSTASGSAPSYSARAWVNFNGTGTPAITASGNVSSITDNGTGDYTVNFTTGMSDANYGATASARGEGNASRGAGALINIPKNAVAPTTSAIRLTVGAGSTATSDGSLVDVDFVNVAIFR